ncbi:MAG: hypothetical protein ACRD4L_14200 [Pyrinomonadaceae bacterium]
MYQHSHPDIGYRVFCLVDTDWRNRQAHLAPNSSRSSDRGGVAVAGIAHFLLQLNGMSDEEVRAMLEKGDITAFDVSEND